MTIIDCNCHEPTLFFISCHGQFWIARIRVGKPMVCMDAGSMSDIEVLLCCSVNFEWLFEQFLRLCLFLFVFPACLLCLFSSSINASLVGRFWLCAWFSRQATAQWVWHLWQWVPACLQRVQSECWVVDFVGSYALLGFYYVQVCCLQLCFLMQFRLHGQKNKKSAGEH